MIMHTHVIILKEFKSSPWAKIQLFLGEHKLKALMVSEHIYVNTIQVVSPDLECNHHCCKIEVMSWIVFLIPLKLSRTITITLSRCINTQTRPTLDESQYLPGGKLQLSIDGLHI